jgi:pimeloyl-ACP methyl ester carboxylesterase
MKKVRSADGTSIAFEISGEGPPLVLVGGAFCDRSARASGTPLAALLASKFTVYSYDRRGRGDSGDTPPYAVARELDDLAALLHEAGASAYVFGNSSGAILALEGALQGLPISKLAMFEPPLLLDATAPKPPKDLAAHLAELAGSGRRSEAAELFLTKVVAVPAPFVAHMQKSPAWRALEALAHTLAYDVMLTARGPALVAKAPSLRIPALALAGTASPPWMQEGVRALADAVPHGKARYQPLEGQTHDVDPKVLAQALESFLI